MTERANEKQQKLDSWRGCLYINPLSYPRFLTLFIEWLRFLVLIIYHMASENREYLTAEQNFSSFVNQKKVYETERHPEPNDEKESQTL